MSVGTGAEGGGFTVTARCGSLYTGADTGRVGPRAATLHERSSPFVITLPQAEPAYQEIATEISESAVSRASTGSCSDKIACVATQELEYFVLAHTAVRVSFFPERCGVKNPVQDGVIL